jgi:serine/threonine protein kinase
MDIERLSEVWPGWHVEELIGEGSFGKVYKAVREEFGITSTAAIKVISIPQSEQEVRSLSTEGYDEATSRTYFEGIVQDFVSEIRLMESMKGTTNVVSVEDFQVLEKKEGIGWDILIRMELLTPFDEWVKGRSLTETEIIKLGTDICTALELCAQKNIIHRDIKPENIFVSSFGDFKLGDFGIARELEKTKGNMSSKGTQNYIAPEVAAGRSYDARVDIYSLGLVLYRLANNNRLPFIDPKADTIRYQERENAVARRLAGDPLPVPLNASPALADAILAACAFEPSRRFSTPTALKVALTSIQGSRPRAARVAPVVAPAAMPVAPPAPPVSAAVFAPSTTPPISTAPAASAVSAASTTTPPVPPVVPVPSQPTAPTDLDSTRAARLAPEKLDQTTAARPVTQAPAPVPPKTATAQVTGKAAGQAAEKSDQPGTQKQPDAQSASSKDAPKEPAAKDAKKRKSKKGLVIVIVLILVALLGVGGFFVYRLLNAPESSEEIEQPDVPVETSVEEPVVEKVEILFDVNYSETGTGGSSIEPQKHEFVTGEAYGTLPQSSRDGHRFLGWYTARVSGQQITATSTVALRSGTTLYAHWEAIESSQLLTGMAPLQTGSSAFVTAGEAVKDNMGDNHSNALLGSRYCYNEYALGGKYNKFTATASVTFDDRTSEGQQILLIYGDGEVLFMENIQKGVEPIDIDINITGVDTLRIETRYVDRSFTILIAGPTVKTAASENLSPAVTEKRTYIDTLDYFDASTSDGGLRRFSQETLMFDNMGKGHVRGLYAIGLYSRNDVAQTWNDYKIGGEYTTLNGQFAINWTEREVVETAAVLYIYGDEELLYTSPNLSKGVEPITFSVDVKDVSTLRFEIRKDGARINDGAILLTECYLL